jgi:hypothetical protein
MANTILSVLHAYQKYIEAELVAADYKLAKAPPIDKQGIDKPAFVIPVVTTGCLPHANFSLYGATNEFFQAPYIMVGFDDNNEDYEEAVIQLLIQVCCYSTASYITDETDERFNLDIPDNKAFEDCINLLEWIKQRLISKGSIAGSTIDRPIRTGSYNTKELTYPYSFGYLSVPVNMVPQNTLRNIIYKEEE